jgi:hypothetical protein
MYHEFIPLFILSKQFLRAHRGSITGDGQHPCLWNSYSRKMNMIKLNKMLGEDKHNGKRKNRSIVQGIRSWGL